MFGFFSRKRREEEKRRRDAVRAEMAGGTRYRDRTPGSSADAGYNPALYGGLAEASSDNHCGSSSSDSGSSCSSSDGGGDGGGGGD